jgi:hypothetical protein
VRETDLRRPLLAAALFGTLLASPAYATVIQGVFNGVVYDVADHAQNGSAFVYIVPTSGQLAEGVRHNTVVSDCFSIDRRRERIEAYRLAFMADFDQSACRLDLDHNTIVLMKRRAIVRQRFVPAGNIASIGRFLQRLQAIECHASLNVGDDPVDRVVRRRILDNAIANHAGQQQANKDL